MLKRVEIPGFGPYICGRKKSELHIVPRFTASAQPQVTHDVNAIREAAKSLKPIYAAVENMLGNDKWGNCTCCAALKIQAIFDCAAGREWRMPTLEDALWLYSQVTVPPFNAETGANDNGAELQKVLSVWQHGLYKDGHGKIKAAYAVDATNKAQVIDALETNGVLYAGCDLPPLWEKITGTGFTWGMVGPPDPNAGHCTWMYGHNDPAVFDSSWGLNGSVPWDALAYYFGGETGELYTVVPA